MIIQTSIQDTKLTRQIQNLNGTQEIILACAILIAVEHDSFTKIQFNLYSGKGSLHLEYQKNILTHYTRNHFMSDKNCNMSVSYMSEFSNTFSSHVTAESALAVFQEYLNVSDQRTSTLFIKKTSVIRIDQLPPTRLIERSFNIENTEISIIKIE